MFDFPDTLQVVDMAIRRSAPKKEGSQTRSSRKYFWFVLVRVTSWIGFVFLAGGEDPQNHKNNTKLFDRLLRQSLSHSEFELIRAERVHTESNAIASSDKWKALQASLAGVHVSAIERDHTTNQDR